MEWVQEVQGLLERDAGWGWQGFWEMILRNLQVNEVHLRLLEGADLFSDHLHRQSCPHRIP